MNPRKNKPSRRDRSQLPKPLKNKGRKTKGQRTGGQPPPFDPNANPFGPPGPGGGR